jgi:hypothetical protein
MPNALILLNPTQTGCLKGFFNIPDGGRVKKTRKEESGNK